MNMDSRSLPQKDVHAGQHGQSFETEGHVHHITNDGEIPATVRTHVAGESLTGIDRAAGSESPVDPSRFHAQFVGDTFDGKGCGKRLTDISDHVTANIPTAITASPRNLSTMPS